MCTLGVNVWYTNWSQGIGAGTPGFYTAELPLKARTTGWTSGQVSRTCADYFIAGGFGLLCQDQVEAHADGGDSGSPVYTWTGQTTGAFAGIVWAKTGTGAFVFSNLDRIEADMGYGVTYGPN